MQQRAEDDFTPSVSRQTQARIEILQDQIQIKDLVFNNPDLANLLRDFSQEERQRLLTEIIDIGTIVYLRVQTSSDVDFVRRHFESFAGQLESKIGGLEQAFNKAVETSLSLDHDESAAKKLVSRFNELHQGVQKAIADARRELQEDQDKLKEDMGKAFTEEGRLGQLLTQIAEFERKVAERFNPSDKTSFLGQMLGELQTYFDPQHGKISTLLDSRLSFDNPESPFYLFAQGVRADVNNLKAEIEAYRTALLGEEKLRAEKERGTQKGFEFEDEVEEALQGLARPFGDEVERVSGARERGDFLYNFKGGWCLVIETKDETMTSLPRYKRILDESMEVWHGDYAMILSKDPDQLQPQVGEWNEYDGNKLITAFPYLRIGINWVRLRLAMTAQVQEGIDIEGVVQETERIKAALRGLKEVRKQLSAIVSSKDRIDAYIAELERGVLLGIEGIINKLETAQAN